MKALKPTVFAVLACWILSGCATDRGGAYDTEPSGASNPSYGVSNEHWPAASPTFRPGMNPADIRDPNALRRPGTYP
jgi:hypothetical protein